MQWRTGAIFLKPGKKLKSQKWIYDEEEVVLWVWNDFRKFQQGKVISSYRMKLLKNYSP
jgi:hypothetical protein